jgi:hypothetical protein
MIDQRIANKARATFDDYATALPVWVASAVSLAAERSTLLHQGRFALLKLLLVDFALSIALFQDVERA